MVHLINMWKSIQLNDPSSGMCGLKLKCDQMAEVKRGKTPSVGKAMEQLELSYTGGGVQNSTNT